MTQPAAVASLLDVDDTLLDNDEIVAGLTRHLTQAFTKEREERCRSRRMRPDAPEPPRELR